MDPHTDEIGAEALRQRCRESEAALEQSRREAERYRRLYESAPLPGQSLDAEGRIVEVNPAWSAALGYARDEVLEQPFIDFLCPEDRERFRESFENLKRQGRMPNGITLRLRHRDGRLLDMEVDACAWMDEAQNFAQSHCTLKDVTGRRHAEVALRESEARFRKILDQVDIIPVQGYDADRRVVYWNRASEEVYGYPREEALGRRLEDLIIPDAMRDEVIALTSAWMAGGPAIPAGELVLRNKQGQPVRVYSSHVLHETIGGQRQMFCVDVNLGPLSEVEKALRESEGQKDLILNATAEAILYLDTELRVVWANRATAAVAGRLPEKLRGAHSREVWKRSDPKQPTCPLRQTLDRKEPCQAEIETSDGRHWLLRGYPVWDASGGIAGIVAVGQDISARVEAEAERERLEAQYRHAQRMEAIGQLTGGVAHDFNNLLQVINGGTDLAIEDLEPGHPAAQTLREVIQAGERAARLVSQLLVFSRRQLMRPETLGLNDAIEEMLKMLRRLIGEHVQMEWTPAARHDRIHADRGMIEQALVNLCVNARDAMPSGGKLIIQTQDTEVDEDFCATRTWARPGRYVLLSVSDTGCGMDNDTVQRIFEPFFTTKEVGKGTGLGLASVYGIVRQHEGMINVYSEPGRGSVFKLYWPYCERAMEGKGPQLSPAEADGGTETVLLAEDDEHVRNLAQRLLQRAGYSVLTAVNGAEALALYEPSPEAFDLVMLDVVMPRMGGRETYEKMRKLRPGQPVLFASGYSEEALQSDFGLKEGRLLLSKPFNREALLRGVREALDG